MVNVVNQEILLGERPTTRRRPFAMKLNESGSELLLPESTAPIYCVGTRMCSPQRERPQSAIARPRSAPPADKLGTNDGGALRSQSALARPRRKASLGGPEVLCKPIAPLANNHGVWPCSEMTDAARPRTAPRRDGASLSNVFLPFVHTLQDSREDVDIDNSRLGVRLLLLALIYLS